MNREYDLEHEIASVLAERAPVRPPEHLLNSVISSARRKRQVPRWYALLKEPTMHFDSRLAVGSPTARVAAIMVATLLLALLTLGAGIAGTRLLAADSAIVVAQDGSGTVTTITEAVAMAQDGDTILVRPGTYAEAVIIEQDVTLMGDGPAEEIVVEAPEDGSTAPTGDLLGARPDASYALLLQDVDSTVSGITFRGEPSRVHAKGGSPVLQELIFEGVGQSYTGRSYVNGGALVSGGTNATIRDCLFEGGNGVISYDASEPLVTDNVLTEGANIGGHYGDGAVIRGNQIIGGLSDGIGITQPTTAVIEGNTISDTPTGIAVGTGGSSYVGVDPIVRANSVSGARTGITVGSGAAPTIEGNTLVANSDTGISLSRAGAATVTGNDLTDNDVGIAVFGSDAWVEGNTVRSGVTGVVISGDATAALTGNTIEGATESGLLIRQQASPTLTDNRICDNGTNLVVEEGAEPIMEDNDICPDPPVVKED